MVEFEVEGKKFVLVRALNNQELRGIRSAYEQVTKIAEDPEAHAGVKLEQRLHESYMMAKALRDCFGMTEDEVNKLEYFTTMPQLFLKLVNHSAEEHGMTKFLSQ